jgi:predicted RNA binding protein YcfA (HicA-like mRNA interferase family)
MVVSDAASCPARVYVEVHQSTGKLCTKPPPADLKWDELRAILEHLGYRLLKGAGSRRKFYHEQKDALIICHCPHPSPNVDKGCVADVVAHLKKHGFISE